MLCGMAGKNAGEIGQEIRVNVQIKNEKDVRFAKHRHKIAWS